MFSSLPSFGSDLDSKSSLSLSEAKREYLRLLEERLKRLARRDPAKFCEYIFEEPLVQMHREWQEAISEHKRLVIIAPRGHGKTTFLSVLRTLFELGQDPDLRVKIVSSTEEIAKDIVFEVTDYMEKSNKLRTLFPHLRPPSGREPWNRTKLYLESRTKHIKDATIEACGILQSPTSGRFDLAIFDDVCSYRNSVQEPALREKVKQSFKGNWIPMGDGPNARIIYIGTPWSVSDLTSELLQNPAFHHIIYRIDRNFTPLWPKKWDSEALKTQRRILGRYEFDRAFRCMPITEEDRLFKLKSIQNSFLFDSIKTDGYEKYTGVDLAIGKSASANFTVIFTIAITDDGKRIPVEIKRGQMTSPETARALVATYEEFEPRCIMVENNFYQQALIDWLQDLKISIPIIPYFTGGQKSDPNIGLPSLADEFDRGEWIIPAKHDFQEDCKCSTCIWIEELVNYPHGKRDDTVIASWLAREAFRKTKIGIGRFQIWDF